MTIKLTSEAAINLNLQGGIGAYDSFTGCEIIKHEPAPFDWADVNPGMAFKEGVDTFWYAAPFCMQEETHVIVFSGVSVQGYPHTPQGKMKKYLTRAREHDIEVK